MTHDERAREIGSEIRKHLFITQPIRSSGPLVEPGLSYEANEIIAAALKATAEEARAEERKWWINKHIEIAAMPAPDITNVIICPATKDLTPHDACQMGWAGCCMAWSAAIRKGKG